MRIPESPPRLNPNDPYMGKIIELMQRDDVSEIIKAEMNLYRPWDKFKHIKTPDGVTSKELWFLVNTFRTVNEESIALGKDDDLVFRYNITSKEHEMLNSFDMAMGGTLLMSDTISDEDKTRYLVNSIMEEAIASSMLEGAVSTREVAKDMLRKERKPRSKDEKMILNNYTTISRVSKLKHKRLTSDMILDIHKHMTTGTLYDAQDEGRYRRHNETNLMDSTNQILFKPPDYKVIPDIIDSICAFANKTDKNQFIHPIIKGIILHFFINYLHPFVDGNGRTGRALFYWYLLSKGYWMIEYMSISRMITRAPMKYARAYLYTEQDKNDLTYFIKYNITTISYAKKGLQEYIIRQVAEKQEFYDFKRIKGINDRQALILKWLSDDPNKMITIKEVAIRFNITYETGRKDMVDLESKGFISHNHSVKKSIHYYRSKQFKAMLKDQSGTAFNPG